MAQPTTTSSGLALGTRPAGTPQTPLLTGTLRLYAIGDSLTVGGTDEVGGNTGRAWRQYVGEMLATSGIAYTAVGNLSSLATTWPNHRAITGQTINTFVTVDFANPATHLNAADPDIILGCTLGYNDINGGASGATTLTRWTSLMELFRAFTNGRGVTPRIVASHLFRGAVGNDTEIGNFNNGLAAAVAVQVALGQKITLIDPRPWLDGIGGAPPFRGDGNHPKDVGYRLEADCVFAGLMNCIGKNAEWGRPTS